MKTLFIPLLAGLLLSCAQSPAQDTRVKEKQESKEKEKQEKEESREKERQEREEAREAEREVKQAEREREREERDRVRYKERYPEEFKEHISKQYTIQKVAGSVLAIYNLDGFIKVQGYAGDKVVIEVDKTIAAKNKEILEQGKSEVKLGFEQIGDSVVAYLLEPWDMRPHDWRDRGNWNDHRRIEYNCSLEFTVKVPFNMNLRVSTINNGDVTVKDVAGTLDVGNVNGAIAIVNAKGTTNAHTINGDLTVNYTSNPPESSSFNTLNGRLTATFQPNLSADLQFKSMNGGFYTDFDSQLLAPTLIKNEEKRGGGTLYRLKKDTQLRIGSGGKQFKFETLNGNIYIKKQS
ncbi:MAG: hypothetical protein JWQ30_2382 [Sediminibacterium sp.]|nr:hypothetical protein [Sediminibacterium sp.]